jgi:hypothetical protein
MGEATPRTRELTYTGKEPRFLHAPDGAEHRLSPGAKVRLPEAFAQRVLTDNPDLFKEAP